jgi:cell division protein FtsA
MGKRSDNIITVIDVGSSKTVVLSAEATDSGLRYFAHGVAESKGTRKGVISDVDKAVSSVQKAVEDAEAIAGVSLENASVGVSGSHIRSVDSRGGITLGTRARDVSREDFRMAVEKARSISMPDDRQIVHLLPREFIVDGQAGILEPTGMIARVLEVHVHVVTASATAVQNVITVLNRAGMQVDDTVYEALAASDAVLRSDERELGAAVVDIGAGSTDIVVFREGVVVHSAVIPIGGDHFTNDVAVGLKTPLGEAERIKRLFGNARAESIPSGNEIEVPTFGDKPSRLMYQRDLGEILEPRARELMEMLRDDLAQAGELDQVSAGVVLTGGGARLQGLLDIGEEVLGRPTRLGLPLPIAKLPAELAEPEYAVAIGMIFYAQRARTIKGPQDTGLGARLKALISRAGFGN